MNSATNIFTTHKNHVIWIALTLVVLPIGQICVMIIGQQKAYNRLSISLDLDLQPNHDSPLAARVNWTMRVIPSYSILISHILTLSTHKYLFIGYVLTIKLPHTNGTTPPSWISLPQRFPTGSYRKLWTKAHTTESHG